MDPGASYIYIYNTNNLCVRYLSLNRSCISAIVSIDGFSIFCFSTRLISAYGGGRQARHWRDSIITDTFNKGVRRHANLPLCHLVSISIEGNPRGYRSQHETDHSQIKSLIPDRIDARSMDLIMTHSPPFGLARPWIIVDMTPIALTTTG